MFKLPKLDYDFAALEPAIDAETMRIHHDLHHGTYVANLNSALEILKNDQPKLFAEISDYFARSENAALEFILKFQNSPDDLGENAAKILNNAGGHLNHSLFWKMLRAPRENNAPDGEIASAIARDFGNFANFCDQFEAAALGQFGSGWAWLISDPTQRKLEIIAAKNQENPISQGKKALLGLDVWEHAYYLKYQNRRGEYAKNFWSIANWDFANELFAA